MIAVTTPTGTPPSIRATTSAAASRLAPNSAEIGRTRRALGPTSMRTKCGTTSPTNPMSPAIATPAAVTSEASPIRITRSRLTSTPRWARRLLAQEEPVEGARAEQDRERSRR